MPNTFPLLPATADVVTIAFGLRNVTDRPAALAEARRVLKPGGRFYCLEFSHVRSRPLSMIYDAWSDVLPAFGGLIARDRSSYQYLVESIRRFPDQEELAAMIAAAGFPASAIVIFRAALPPFMRAGISIDAVPFALSPSCLCPDPRWLARSY